jgi:hypothetical protein
VSRKDKFDLELLIWEERENEKKNKVNWKVKIVIIEEI